MSRTTTIEIPRLPDESARAYDARVRYVTMGPVRSLEKVRGQNAGKTRVTNRLETLEEWSSRFGWVESARRYDEAVAYLTIQEAAAQYRRDLEEHRERYRRAGKDLYAVAQGLLTQCARAIKGECIEGKDGKIYTIPAMEMTPATLSTAVRALTIAADLEAHALRIDDLLPRLEAGHDD